MKTLDELKNEGWQITIATIAIDEKYYWVAEYSDTHTESDTNKIGPYVDLIEIEADIRMRANDTAN
jgi:hypothetical protein